VSTTNAPAALGPYSQAIATEGMVFCSGQVGIDPATKKRADGIEGQTD
jgi:2-iminobutanoate/2-iminopropanoate deaminase